MQNSLDVTKSVLQWNKSAGSSGDYLRVLKPDSSYAFRITGDGDLVWGGNDSLRAQLGALRAEVADLRAQLQAIRSAAAH